MKWRINCVEIIYLPPTHKGLVDIICCRQAMLRAGAPHMLMCRAPEPSPTYCAGSHMTEIYWQWFFILLPTSTCVIISKGPEKVFWSWLPPTFMENDTKYDILFFWRRPLKVFGGVVGVVGGPCDYCVSPSSKNLKGTRITVRFVHWWLEL